MMRTHFVVLVETSDRMPYALLRVCGVRARVQTAGNAHRKGTKQMQFDSNSGNQSNTIAAIFATQHDARDAVKDLHKAGFKKTWLGTTHAAAEGETLVDEPNGLARFLSAGGDNMPLHRALIDHGVVERQAERIEREMAPGCTIVTAYGEDNPSKVQELFQVHKGHVVGPTGNLPTAVDIASASPRTGVEKDERKMADEERNVRDPKARDLGRNGDDDDDAAEYTSETFVERRYSRP